MSLSAAEKTNWWNTLVTYLTETPIEILLIIVVAIVLQFLVIKIIHRIVRRTVHKARMDRPAQTRKIERTAELSAIMLKERTSQRAEAIGGLLTSLISVIIWATALLLILPILGVNIAAVLASAGVIGVALGFGAQTLVKDYLSGIFIIIEDQYGVGDFIDVGSTTGTVEQIALRYTRLRDTSGVVWYVRNGEILWVANRSQGWTLATVDIPVAYDEDLDRVRDIVSAVAIDMDSDPEFDDMLLGTPTYAGVESVSGEAVYIRILAKCAPEQQLPLSRAIRERVKLAFDRAGIRVPVVMPRPYPRNTGGSAPTTGA